MKLQVVLGGSAPCKSFAALLAFEKVASSVPCHVPDKRRIVAKVLAALFAFERLGIVVDTHVLRHMYFLRKASPADLARVWLLAGVY